MSISGVVVSDGAITAYNELKTKKSARFIIYTIKDEKEIVVGDTGARAATFEDFTGGLAKDTPCYAIFDYEWTTADGPRDKILFISWVPDTAKVKSKMLFASSKAGLTQALGGGFQEISASDATDLEKDSIMAKLSKKM